MPIINPYKGKAESGTHFETAKEEKTQEMQTAITAFFSYLLISHDRFESEKAFDALLQYIEKYDRILYSPISNKIYSSYDDSANEKEDVLGSLMTNLEALVSYSQNSTVVYNKKNALKDTKSKKYIDDTQKAILKIWDHVNLANQQYKVLKQSDEEYTEKFKKRISGYKEDMTKEMNAQLLTMVSIFTALAFLIFGGISSLDSILSVQEMPLMKVLSIGLMWGLCIFNLIFLFLFCVGKMTHLNFKSTDNTEATIFQKYPVVWWSDFILVFLLLICLWIYFMQRHALNLWIINICVSSPELATIVGCVLIGIAGFEVMKKLAIVTEVIKKPNKLQDDTTGS